ncbi:hypothetical protein CKU38_01268 [Xanthomonas citri pv. fuscans]|nr:hypothetical protein CKU38_01268 [Xanthomonas citri pv. fuscans]
MHGAAIRRVTKTQPRCRCSHGSRRWAQCIRCTGPIVLSERCSVECERCSTCQSPHQRRADFFLPDVSLAPMRTVTTAMVIWQATAASRPTRCWPTLSGRLVASAGFGRIVGRHSAAPAHMQAQQLHQGVFQLPVKRIQCFGRMRAAIADQCRFPNRPPPLRLPPPVYRTDAVVRSAGPLCRARGFGHLSGLLRDQWRRTPPNDKPRPAAGRGALHLRPPAIRALQTTGSSRAPCRPGAAGAR